MSEQPQGIGQPPPVPTAGPEPVANQSQQAPPPPPAAPTQYAPVQGGQLPGMTPGAFEAAQTPLPVSPEVGANPWVDPNAVQHMMLAAQGLKDFDTFVARNNVARLVPGKKVRGFLRVPNGIVQSYGAMAPGLTLDRTVAEAVQPSDIYIPVMDGEDDAGAYERYQKDLEKWNGSMLPFRWADLIGQRLIPHAAEGGVGNYFAGMAGQIGLPLALDDLRKYVARNSPVYGLERFDTEKEWTSPDWTWAVFGGAMTGGSALARAGMLRFVETGAGQAFMRGMQKAGIETLGDAGLPVAGEGLLGAPLGRSSALFEWLGNKVGTKTFSNIRPETFRRAEDALRNADAQIRVTPQGIDVGFTGSGPTNTAELQAALKALKVEMSNAGEKVAFRIFTDVPSTFGAAAGGAAAGGAAAADPLARVDLSPEQRKLIAQGIPMAMVIGGGIPLGFRAAQGAIDLLSQKHIYTNHYNRYRSGTQTGAPGETPSYTKYLKDVPRQETPPPPQTFGGGPNAGPPKSPGPVGPVTPDSGIYSMPLAKIPSVETNGALSTPAVEQFSIQTLVRDLQRTLPGVQDPKQLLQARRLIDGLAAEQTQMVGAMDMAGADPAMLESRNKAVAARLDAANRLLGKDLTPTTFALGLPTESILFDSNIPPEVNAIEPLRMGLLVWAHGLAAEASRLGLDLPALTATLPPPGGPWDLQTLTMRLQGLAAQVKAADPEAAIGPPMAMTPDLPEEVRRGRPVQVDPVPPTVLPSPEALTAAHFPSASELRSEPTAVRRQTYAAAKMASGMRFHVGDLIPSRPAGLRDEDPIRVPIFQDSSGRLMARMPAHDAADTPIEVTDTLSRLSLPAEAGWEFAPNPLAPIPYRLTGEPELLEVDQAQFEDRAWVRESYKTAVWKAVQGEMGSAPNSDPVSFASSILNTPAQTVEDANGILDQLNQMQAEHEERRPTEGMARTLAGPGATPGDIFRLQAEMVQEYAGMGAMIEFARAKTLAAKMQREAASAAEADPKPSGWGLSSPFGIEAARTEERHRRGPAIYNRLSQVVNALDPESKWTPDTLMNRLNADGVSREDLDIADVRNQFIARAMTKEAKFKRWFEGSAVVDEQSRPKMMAHGTLAETQFQAFRPFSHFGTPEAANHRIQIQDDTYMKGFPGRVFPVFLKIKNPLRLPDMIEVDRLSFEDLPLEGYKPVDRIRGSWESPDFVLHYLERKGIIAGAAIPRAPSGQTLEEKDEAARSTIIKALKARGYDGIVYKNAVEDEGQDSYIIFDATQVKSAIGNRGTYSEEDPDIAMSAADKPKTQGYLTAAEAGKVIEQRGGEALAETLQSLVSEFARKGDKAQTRFDPKLIGALGASQYGGALGPIVVKELLQNAKDGLMAEIEKGWKKSERPKISLRIAYTSEPTQSLIEISDNGIGMPPEVAEKEYVEIGGSYKPQEAASGGFGLAKIAYFPNAVKIEVTTVAETPNGRMKTTLEGTGEDWADTEVGLAMKVTPADATEDTGTIVRLTMNEKANFDHYQVHTYLDSFSNYSDLPFDFEYERFGNRGVAKPKPRSLLLTHETPGANVHIFGFENAASVDGYCNLFIGNNGIYQFESAMYSLGTFPSSLWVDVRAKVPVDDPSNTYPFTTNREQLKSDIQRSIEGRIIKDIGAVMHNKKRDMYRKIVEDSPQFFFSEKHHVVDTQQNLPKDLIEAITLNKDLSDLFDHLAKNFSSYLGALHELTPDASATSTYARQRVRFFGLGLSGKYYGINIGAEGLGRDKNHILVNPFVSYQTVKRYVQRRVDAGGEVSLSIQAEMLAKSIQATIIHEITHQEAWPHKEEFSSALTNNLSHLAHQNSRFSKRLQELLEAHDGHLFNVIAQFAGELEPYWRSGADALDSISAHSRRPTGPRDDQSGPPDRGGRRSGERGSVRRGPGDAPASMESGAAVPGGRTPQEEAEARLRAEALARIASGAGWSGRNGPRLFAALTDAERLDALASRIAAGKFVNRKHLMAMSPQKWEATGKYPKFFGKWQPTPSQMTVLKDTFNERLAIFNKSTATLEKILAASKPRVPGGMRPPLLDLADITGIDPTHLEELAKDPHAFDEWVRQFYRSIDPIYNDPAVQAQQDVRQHIDLMKDAVRSMGDNRVLAGVHPYDDPPTAFGALTKLSSWAHNQQAIMQGRIRMLGRPSYVIGWRKQITHPAEWNENREELSRNVYHILYSAYLKHAQDLEGHIQQTATLNQAASRWMSAQGPLPSEDATLDLNAPPPKSMSPSVVLDRAIATFLDQRPSAAEIEKSRYRHHEVKIGLIGTAKIDLAVEMPKLYKLYDTLIGKAEQAMILKNRTESVRYKAKGEALEGEIRARVLRAARLEAPEADYQSFEQLHVDVVTALVKNLRVTDMGNRGADPMSIGARGFKSVEAGWRSALREYRKRVDMIAGIQNGDLRREGYYTAVHKMTVDEVRNMLRDPQSVWSRYTTPDVRNYFLNERKSDSEPYRSWAVGWTFYLPAMLRTIHLEPALINVVPKIQQLPSDMRDYADQVVRQMKGDLDPTDRLMNQLAMATWAESPTLSSELSRWAGKDHIERLRQDPETRLQLVGSKAWTRFVESIAGGTYLALMSPIKVAKMTVTELAFWGHEAMKRPQDMLHLTAFGAAGLGRAGFEGVRELASWLHAVGYGGPRWYGEATMMKVTDSLNELALERHTLPTHLDAPAKLFKSAVQTWYGVMRSTEYSLRASTYYALKWNAKRFGLDEDDAREYAARTTNDLIGAFGPLETTPSPRGTTGRAVFQFKRFLAAKTDLLMGDFTNTTRLFMPNRDLNLALGHGGGAPPPDTPLGLAVAHAAPPGTPPPPPPLTNSSFGVWEPDERNAWDSYSEPVAHMGSQFASSRTAQWRSFLAFLGLVAAAYPNIGFITQFARLFWEDDDPNAPGQSILDMMFPWDFRRLNTIPMLWPIEYVERIALLEAKKHAPFTGGLTSKEARELEIRKRTMVEAAWPVGAALKQQRYDEQQKKYDEGKAKSEQRKLNSRPHPPRPPRPPTP